MVIEVIAGQVCKCRCRHRETIEPILVETMARGFDRHMLDPSRCQSRRDHDAARPDPEWSARRTRRSVAVTKPERAEARRWVADRGPDLAREMDDRGLAVGPGYRGDRSRLPAVEARR